MRPNNSRSTTVLLLLRIVIMMAASLSSSSSVVVWGFVKNKLGRNVRIPTAVTKQTVTTAVKRRTPTYYPPPIQLHRSYQNQGRKTVSSLSFSSSSLVSSLALPRRSSSCSRRRVGGGGSSSRIIGTTRNNNIRTTNHPNINGLNLSRSPHSSINGSSSRRASSSSSSIDTGTQNITESTTSAAARTRRKRRRKKAELPWWQLNRKNTNRPSLQEQEVWLEPYRYGPTGRPTVTEAKLLELVQSFSSKSSTIAYGSGLVNLHTLLGTKSSTAVSSTFTPKQLVNQAPTHKQLKPYFKSRPHFVTEQLVLPASDAVLFQTTVITHISIPASAASTTSEASLLYNKMMTMPEHEHIIPMPHRASDGDNVVRLEVRTTGIGATKQRSSQLAALDQLILWHESTGLDFTMEPQDWWGRAPPSQSKTKTNTKTMTKNKNTNQPDTVESVGPLGRPAVTKAFLHDAVLAQQKSVSSSAAAATEEIYGTGLVNFLGLIGYRPTTNQGSFSFFNYTTSEKANPKMSLTILNQKAGWKPPQYRSEVVQDPTTAAVLHKATVVTVVPKDNKTTPGRSVPATLSAQLQGHPHVAHHPDYAWWELISVGLATNKKHAAQLAALDQLVLVHETLGVDCSLPQWQDWLKPIQDDLHHPAQQQQRDAAAHVNFETRYKQSQTLLELLQCSTVQYEHEEVLRDETEQEMNTVTKNDKNSKAGRNKKRKKKKKPNKAKLWLGTAETKYQGQFYDGYGKHKTKTKKEAEQYALVALLEQNESLRQDAAVYQQLMEQRRRGETKTPTTTSCSHIVTALAVPELSNDMYTYLQQALGYAGEDTAAIYTLHEERKYQHRVLTERYEQNEVQKQERKKQNQQRQQSFKNKDDSTYNSGNNVLLSQTILDQERTKLEYQQLHNILEYTKMEAIRKALPIHAIRETLLEKLKTNQVVVVSGGTGSGKSTQCPQYILEDAIANHRGGATKIIVTQPRRIAAIGVSDRVANERYNDNSVGYTVRFSSKKPRKEHDGYGSIEFVTAGILLRRLMSGGSDDDRLLKDISHVIIDEVHERDINNDFLLILLRDLLKKRPELKLILMSATLDAKSFSDYFATTATTDSAITQSTPKKKKYDVSDDKTQLGFDEVPLLSVPSKPRYPVEVHYLEDIASTLSRTSNTATDGTVSPMVEKLTSLLLQYNDDKLKKEYEDTKYTASKNAENNTTACLDNYEKAIALRKAHSLMQTVYSPSNSFNAKKFDFRATLAELISHVALHICDTEKSKMNDDEAAPVQSGSILCFLPGMDEIKLCMKQVEEVCRSSYPQLLDEIEILPLHSTIPQDDQQKVFKPAPLSKNGTPKIKLILSTNIAESSITIDDVLAVIDSGLVREMNFNSETNMNTMETNRISKASATQRLGRCGRVGPGTCYRLFSSTDIDADIMKERATPEIQRTSLEGTCLQTCFMMMNNNNNNNADDGNGNENNDAITGVEDFLSRALDPPIDGSVGYAMNRLTKLGAISISSKEDGSTTDDDNNDNTSSNRSSDAVGREYLTPLGRCLARLPLDPATGKMLVMGVVMKCLDPVLTAASCFGSKDAFHVPATKRDEVKEIRTAFSDGKSDILANVRAYDKFYALVDEVGWYQAKTWAYENSVSISAMTSMKAVRSQLLNELRKVRLIPYDDFCVDRNNKRWNNKNKNPRSSNHNSLRPDASVNENAYSDLLVSAVWCTAFPDNLASRRRSGGGSGSGAIRTSLDDHAELHPSSVLFHGYGNYKAGRQGGRHTNRYQQPLQPKELPEWYLFNEKVLTSKLFLRGCSAMLPEQVLLFGGYNLDTTISNYLSSSSSDSSSSSSQNTNANDSSKIRGVLDGWIAIEGGKNKQHKFKSTQSDNSVDLLIRARENLDMIFERRIMFPTDRHKTKYNHHDRSDTEDDDTIVNAIRDVYEELATASQQQAEYKQQRFGRWDQDYYDDDQDEYWIR